MLSTFISDTQSHHKDLKVDIKLENREVVFNGPLLMVRKARLRMYEILQSASSTVVTDVPHVHVSLLATDEARDAVNNRLRQAGLAATWECCGNVVVVYSLHQTALPLAVNVIKTSFKSERIVLDKSSSSLHTTAEWKDNVEKLLKKHLGLLKISTDHRTILVTAFCDIMSTVKENINKCALESSMSSAAFQLSPSRLKFVTLFWEEKVSSIAVKLKGYKINITLQSDRVLVGGTKQGIELVRKELNSLSEQIICTEELIIRKETIRCLSTLRNNNELQAIAFTCKCVLSLHPENVSVEMSATNLPAEGPRVHAVQGDITQLPVDVIVNAANELMDRAGGFAGGIALKGNVLVSGPGKLPCKAIIHAGGPRYKGGNKGEEECLRDTVMECLKTASDRRYTSIAIPAISSGIFGYPVKEATRVIVQAVKLFFETNRDSSITDVQLADIRIDTVQEFQKALKAIYSNYTPITKQGLSGKEQSPTIGTISAIQGDITQMTVDVIVNAANERMTHDNGLAGYIVRKGGDTIQEECYRILRTRGKLSEGDVLVSGPGKLPFKAIIHAVGPAYRGGTRGEEECLRGTVLKCLMTASHQGYTSIAIPAISTGSLRYPAEEATRVIVQAVRVFFDTSPKSSIKDVRLCDISRSTVEDFKGAIQAASEEMDLSSASSQATSQTEMSSPSRWFRLSPRMTQPRNTFSSEKGVDKGTRKPKALSPPETLKLYIFTADPQRKEHFLKALDEFVDSKFVEQEIEDFDQISPDMLEDACKKYNVELLLWDSGATVGGMSEDVQKLKEEISSMIKTAERQQQESMIANLVQWYYFDTTSIPSKRVPFERRENHQLENAYQMKRDTVKLRDSEGSVYVCNFKNMTCTAEFNLAIAGKIMRKEKSEDLACPLPETWEPLCNEPVKRVLLVAGCPEYNSVKANMSRTANNPFTIISIERIQNGDLYRQYVAKKAQIDRQNNGMSSEKTLWHGTSLQAIDNINLYGFNRSFCGRNATAYGQGVYFAVNSSYSMSDTYSVRDQSGNKHMYQCKVLVGCPTVGNSDMKFLPTRRGKIRYDSATDSTSQPSQYVIFNDTQAYPEYLITFQYIWGEGYMP
ncbi:poly [ADP-ribose] polymerase 14-like isoform X2 [Pomacea canaliculata]|uniref:poly [ADP-ribose] polymerase 14-like isoform X2 n=1 Tax=Pomacea canaliculata TaxID=400727 RepID=UPI000D72FE72|nr:poly [ADP-ribose] polymerase 14-like isoform X2 [Pomacea canaliculata]